MAYFRDGHYVRRHRLPRPSYQGRVTVAFHTCLARRQRLLTEAAVVDPLLAMLDGAAARFDCVVRAYCFMPDHLHVIFSGMAEDADTWEAMRCFKQCSGPWLSRNLGAAWQKSFYDGILYTEEEAEARIRYVLENPIRQKLATDWGEYPFAGLRPPPGWMLPNPGGRL